MSSPPPKENKQKKQQQQEKKDLLPSPSYERYVRLSTVGLGRSSGGCTRSYSSFSGFVSWYQGRTGEEREANRVRSMDPSKKKLPRTIDP